MDRRQLKTRKAIFDAFTTLLSQKSYTSITIQEIIDLANIGRSTFYSHFETKDELLDVMCKDLFSHVFNHPEKEANHDFSSKGTIHDKITHILCHIKEDSKDLKGLLTSDSSDYFFLYIKNYYSNWLNTNVTFKNLNMPADYLLNYASGSFIEAIKWWLKKAPSKDAEDIAYFYEITVLNNIAINN